MKVLIVFYSFYGHIYEMARAEAEGAGSIEGAQVTLRKFPETLSDDILKSIGSYDFQKSISDIPVLTHEDLVSADAIIFGTPTRFGNMCGQVRQFLDSTGQLWTKGSLIGKVAGVFTSSATQHGGQESTILSFIPTLLHHGMIVAGLPYSFQGQMGVTEITGCSPYGASTIAGGDGKRMPSKNELDGARFQGKHIAGIAGKLVK
jgi:NAD(P)H dehydrogenase (quinone)